MYNQRNYNIAFGQNPDRLPRPQFLPQPSGPVQPFQLGPPVPSPPLLIQQTGPPNAYGAPQPTTMALMSNFIQNSGQPFSNPPLSFHGRTHMASSYSMSQHYLQCASQNSAENARYAPPPQDTVAHTGSHFFNSFPSHPLPPSVQSLPSCPSSSSSEALNVPPPPPRPNSTLVVRNIEILCSFISKNGPEFEDMACQKEVGNPEFSFLFGGGEPGSEAAVAREYYLWTRKKSCLEYDLLKGKTAGITDTVLNELHPSTKPYNSEEALHSLSDSDMEMEDDITCPDSGQMAGSNLINSLNQEPVLVGNVQMCSGDSMQKLNLIPHPKLPDDDTRISDSASVKLNVGHEHFRLVEEYASDDNSERGDEACVSVDRATPASPHTKDGFMTSDDMMSHNTDSVATGSNLPKSDQMVPELVALGNDGEATASGTNTSDPSFSKDFKERETLVKAGAGDLSEGSKCEKEHVKSSMPLKVDEFGRIVREGVSDTDSDDSHFTMTYDRRGRTRTHSPSQSPVDNRKRRRSPLRRRERRSRSRSWSPRRRRSRSRSPLRRTGGFNSEKLRQRKSHVPRCSNFVNGRCYRGAFCKYMHDDSNKYEGFKQRKGRHHLSEAGDSSRTDSHKQDQDTHNRFPSDHVYVKGGKAELPQEGYSSSHFPSTCQVDDEEERAEPMNSSALSSLLGQHGYAPITVEKENATLYNLSSLGKSDANAVSDLTASKINDAQKYPEDQEIIHHETGVPAHQGFNNHDQSQQLIPPVSESSCGMSSVPSHLLPQVEAQVSMKCAKSISQKDVVASDSFTANLPHHVSKPSPLSPPPLQCASITSSNASLPNHGQSQQLIPPVSGSAFGMSSVPSHLLPQVEAQVSMKCEESMSQKDVVSDTFTAYLPYHVSKPSPLPPPPLQCASNTSIPNQQCYYPSIWGNLRSQHHVPPYANPSMPGPPEQLQLSEMTVRKDTSLRLNPSDHVSQSHTGLLQTRAFPDHHQPPMHGEDFRNTILHSSNLLSKPSDIPNVPTGLLLPSSYAQESTLPGPVAHQHRPYLQNQSLTYGLCQTASDSVSSKTEGSLSLPRYSSDLGFRTTPHYNPYASTFDQPLSSKFSSISHRQEEMTIYGNKHVIPSRGLREVSQGAILMVASPHSSRAGDQGRTRSSGDQYDPLFDSIEPSSASFKKMTHQLDGAADNSDIMLRLSDAHKLLDVEEKKSMNTEEVGADATSIENYGFGETDEAEIDPAESQSPSGNDGDKPAAEAETGRVKKGKKSKKSKDSRSMRLFKAELACFVKEVLKPSWRQGNMSKEAFKTIVKKTVEKVSGAMRGGRIPKSKGKINQYIESSHRKLTQLVEGYVNKYAKA